MSTRWWRRSAAAMTAALAALLSIGAISGSAVAADGVAGSIQTSATEIVVGEPFPVSLTGWPQGIVAVSLCGERAAAGSADCALTASAQIPIGVDGVGEGSLIGALPPSGCPCVLRATMLTGGLSATLPVVIPAASGAPEAYDASTASGPTSTGVPVARLVVSASLEPSGEWWHGLLAALGGPTQYRLTVTAQNIGTAVSPARTVEVLAGRDTVSGDPVGTLVMSQVDAGQQVTRSIDVSIGAPLVGTYTVHGELDPSDQASSFAVELTSWPVIPLVIAVLVLSWLFFATRARRKQAAPEQPAPSRWVPVLRAIAVTAIVSIVAVGAHWGLTRWFEHASTAQAQSELLAEFALARDASATTAAAPAGQRLRPFAQDAAPPVGDLVGVLRFPSLDQLELAVVAGVTTEQLARGPGHYPGTALPGELGNVAVAGHNSRTHAGAPFVDLDKLAVGDTIVFETSDGVWHYTVTGARVVPPTAISVLLPVRDDPHGTPTSSQLTLITCDFGTDVTNRLIIEAEITDPTPATA